MRYGTRFKWRVLREGEPVAPRPHRTTVILGLLSPTLALVALGVSLYSLYASSEATRRGQQAYIGATPARFQFHEEAVGPQGEQAIVYLDATFALQNAGNTPATLFSTTVEWSLDDIAHLIPPDTVSHTVADV